MDNTLTPPDIPAEFLPRHIALVMDGNGRWAQQRGMNRTEGHKRGEAVLMEAVDACLAMGVPYLSAYAFFHRKLAAQRRRGPLPHGLFPGRVAPGA